MNEAPAHLAGALAFSVARMSEATCGIPGNPDIASLMRATLAYYLTGN
jgi:hypothetical protein